MSRFPLPYGADWKTWGRQVIAGLGNALDNLRWKTSEDVPAQNGSLLWDEVLGHPVVAKDGEWREVVVSNGDAQMSITSNVTAAAANTAYALAYTIDSGHDITLAGTPATRVTVAEAGEYLFSFSAQITSSSSSTVNFWFWPRLNGVDVSNASMKNGLHQNGATLVVTRTAIFDLSAGDYIEAMWAVDSTSGSLANHTATAFAPATPATTLSVTRLHG